MNSNCSSSHRRKDKTISTQAIVYSIERDINDLLSQINIRSQRDSLISMKDSLKYLLKGLNIPIQTSTNEANDNEIKGISLEMHQYKQSNTISFNPLKANDERRASRIIAERKDNHSPSKFGFHHSKTYIPQLNDQIKLNDNKSPIPTPNRTNMTEESPEISNQNKVLLLKIQALESEVENINQTFTLTKEEYEKNNNDYTAKLCSLQEALKAMNEEYDSLCIEFDKTQQENAKIINREIMMKKAYANLKSKNEQLLKVNEQFTQRLLQNEFDQKQMKEQLQEKNITINKMKALISNIENKNTTMINELNKKDQKLKILREMNNSLESKSSRLIKEFDSFQNTNNNSYFCNENITFQNNTNILNSRLSTEEQDSAIKGIDLLTNENNTLKKEIAQMKIRLKKKNLMIPLA